MRVSMVNVIDATTPKIDVMNAYFIEPSSVVIEPETSLTSAPMPPSATERPISVPRKPSDTDTPGSASARRTRPGLSITVSSLM